MLHTCPAVMSSIRRFKGLFSILIPLFLLSSGNAFAYLGISPNNLNLGSVDVGSTSEPQTLTLINDSSFQSVLLSSISATGDFDYTTNCTGSMPPLSSCTVDVTFSPQTSGTLTGDLIIVGDDPALDPAVRPPAVAARVFNFTAPLTGVGLLGEVSVSTTEVDFGSVTVNSQSETISVPISNSGNAPLTISSISASAPFEQTNDCPASLTNGESCSVEVSVTPDNSGTINGTLAISGSNQSGAIQQTVVLSVSAAAVATSVSPSSVTFPQSDTGTTSDPQTVTLENMSDVTIQVQSISTEGDFTQTNDCPTQLVSGSSCQIQVVFSPQSTGDVTGNLIVTTDTTTTTVSLAGTAATPTSDNPVADLLSPYTGGNPNVISTSKVIGEACPSGRISDRMQEDCNDVVGAAIGGDANTGSALRQVTPESATKANRSSRQGGEAQIRNLGSRIAALRAGARGLSFRGLDLLIDDKNLSIDTIAQAYKGRHGAGASGDNPLMESRLGVFITGDISTGSKDETDLEAGLDFDTYGITMGVDYRITNNFILGGAVGYVDTNTELEDDVAEIDTQGYSLNLYGTYYAEQNYFVDFSLGYGANNFDQSRSIIYQLDGLADVNQNLSADYDGDMVSFFIGSGYDFNRAGWTFGPRADLEYIKSDVDGFTEETSDPTADGGGWATRIDDTDQTWLTLKLGGRVSYTQGTDWGVLIPYARLDWLHEFEDDSQVISAHFVGDPNGQAIQIETDDPDRDYLRLRIGTSAQFKNGMVGLIDYGTILAHSDWTSHTISVGFRTEF
ncbi:MAG: autotransporter domain-containing protein [Candidatus Thiodiazotropha sp. 6PDIVS]